MRPRGISTLLVAVVVGGIVSAFAAGGCAIVPQTRRRWLADPTMRPTESALENKALRKLHTTREGAAGGDGEAAGGGCGCAN